MLASNLGLQLQQLMELIVGSLGPVIVSLSLIYFIAQLLCVLAGPEGWFCWRTWMAWLPGFAFGMLVGVAVSVGWMGLDILARIIREAA